MLVIKKLFLGNYLKKLHHMPCSKFEKKENNQNEQNENKINIEEEISNKFYLISIYESSIDINKCEYDTTIKQYIQIPIINQKFFFVIFDSGIIDDKIIILTSLGLFIYHLEENKLNMIYNDIFNTKCEPKDILMYLKINEKLKILTVHSNTNLFFLYYYNEKLNKCQKVNQINKLCDGFIKKINIFSIEEDMNYFIISIQARLAKKLEADNYFYKFNKINNDNYEVNEIDIGKMNEDDKKELIMKKNKYIKYLFKEIYEKYDEKDHEISEIIYTLYGNHLFIIKENGYIILKRKKGENEDIDNIDLLRKNVFKYFTEKKKSFLIDYININNFHLLFFDNKVKLYEEKNTILSRIKLVPKENKKYLKNSNVIIQSINNKEISLILYTYKNDISFINIAKENNINDTENIINDNNYMIKLITRCTNESMFCVDGAIINNNKDSYKILGICGLKGESRLIKYSNIFNEINLFNKNIDNEIKSISLTTDNFKNDYFSNILMTSNNIKSNLYLLNTSFALSHIKEFSSQVIKIYPVTNFQNTYTIVLKKGIDQIIFNDITNYNNYKLNNIYQCETNETNNVSILFSYNFIYEQNNYVVVYLTNKHMMCFNVNNLSVLFDTELKNLPQPSSLGVIVIENLKKIGFIFGNYINNHIMTIYYDIQGKSFDMENISETKILDSQGKYLLIPEDILIYKYYIFITTHTGDFIILYFNDKNLYASVDIIFNLENITRNQSPLKFAQIEFNQNINEFNIDFYSLKNAYNIKIRINRSNNNEIQCNSSQLSKYNFNQNRDLPLLSFKKIYSDNKNNTNIHFYLHRGLINFSYFQESNNNIGLLNKSYDHIINQIIGCTDQIQKNNIKIETIFKFPQDEKAIKIININENDNEILVLTNNLKLYLFDEELKLILTKKISDEVKKADLKIKGIKNYVIKKDDMDNDTNINIIVAYGSAKSGEINNNSDKGILVIYQYINNNIDNDNSVILKLIRVVHGYPSPIIDVAFIKNFVICSIDTALCIKQYNIKDSEFLWKSEGQAKIINNFMNKPINLVPLNKFCNNYFLLTGDIYESFHLIKFSSVNPANYETLGADLSLNSLSNIYPVNNNSNEVFITDKKGIITKFSLNKEIYNINNRVDLKEYISKLYVHNDKIIMIGLLGSLYYGEILDNNNNREYEKELLKFQKDVFNEVSNINLGKNVEYEESMLMSEKINNVLLVDTLINFCGIYYKELSNKIQNFSNYVKAVKLFNDNLIIKNE